MRSLTGNGTDILQKHSINSILEQRKDILNQHSTDPTESFISSSLVGKYAIITEQPKGYNP